jgi:hypothetical protein
VDERAGVDHRNDAFESVDSDARWIHDGGVAWGRSG